MDTGIWKGVGVVVGMHIDINLNMDIDIDMMYLLGKDTENMFAHTHRELSCNEHADIPNMLITAC